MVGACINSLPCMCRATGKPFMAERKPSPWSAKVRGGVCSFWGQKCADCIDTVDVLCGSGGMPPLRVRADGDRMGWDGMRWAPGFVMSCFALYRKFLRSMGSA